jgi:hypothetical protein
MINLDALPQPALARLLTSWARRSTGAPRWSTGSATISTSTTWPRRRRRGPVLSRPGLAPPPNAPLRLIDQALGVLGWKDAVPRERWRALRDDLTADPTSTAINVNTATPAR